MPGKKSQPKSSPPKVPSAASPKSARSIQQLIDETECWDRIVRILAEHYQLPDLRSKKGLKECFRNIEAISSKLNDRFDETPNERMRCGIVGIWEQLGYDGVICSILIEQGVLQRIVSMLNGKEFASEFALHALKRISGRGGRRFQDGLAVATPQLIKCMQIYPNNPRICTYVMLIMGHSIADFDSNGEPLYKRYPSIKMEHVLPAVHGALCATTPSIDVFSHIYPLIMSSAGHAHSQLEGHQPSLEFMVGCLRVCDLKTRAAALSAILTFRLPKQTASPNNRHDDTAGERSGQRLLKDVFMTYTPSTYEEFRAAEEFQNKMKIIKGEKLWKQGLKVAEILRRSDYALSKDYFQDEDINGMTYRGFIKLLGILPIFLSKKDHLKCSEAATIIQLKYFMLQGNYDEILHATTVPTNEPYLHYMRILADPEDHSMERSADRLQWAVNGLLCPDLSDFLRFSFLEIASRAAFALGLHIINFPMKDTDIMLFGTSCLHNVQEWATTFVNEAPLDCRDMGEMLAILMCTTLVLQGKKMSPQLTEFESFRNTLKKADQSQETGGPVQVRKAYETIVQKYEAAANLWDSRLAGCTSHTMQRYDPSEEDIPIEKLKEWLFSATKCTENGDCSCPAFHHNTVTVGRAEDNNILHRCSYCQDRSAALRRCGRCQKARYCNAKCQTAHWTVHKSECIPMSK